MIVDAGSPVSIISESLYRKQRKLCPALQNIPLRLSRFLAPLLAFGKLDMKVHLGAATVSSWLLMVGKALTFADEIP